METRRLPVVKPLEAISYMYNRSPSAYRDFESWRNVDHDKAFKVAYLAKDVQIAAVRQQLVKALDEGQSFEDFKGNLKVSDAQIPHAKTVWQTNLFASFNKARNERFRQDQQDYPYLLFEAVDDAETRPNHAINDGLCMPINSPDWSGRTPPLGFNCRCILRNVTRSEASSQGKRFTPNADGSSDSPEWGSNDSFTGGDDSQELQVDEEGTKGAQAYTTKKTDRGFPFSALLVASAAAYALSSLYDEQEVAAQATLGRGQIYDTQTNEPVISELVAQKAKVLQQSLEGLDEYDPPQSVAPSGVSAGLGFNFDRAENSDVYKQMASMKSGQIIEFDGIVKLRTPATFGDSDVEVLVANGFGYKPLVSNLSGSYLRWTPSYEVVRVTIRRVGNREIMSLLVRETDSKGLPVTSKNLLSSAPMLQTSDKKLPFSEAVKWV